MGSKGKGKRSGISYYSCFLQRVEVKCNNGARNFLLCLLGKRSGSPGVNIGVCLVTVVRRFSLTAA